MDSKIHRKRKKRRSISFPEALPKMSFPFPEESPPLLNAHPWIDPIIQDSLLSQVHNGGEKWKKEKNDPRKLQATNGQKWWIAVIIGFLFFILASPSAFKITNKLFKVIHFPKTYSNGITTFFGLFIHMLIFILIIRLILW